MEDIQISYMNYYRSRIIKKYNDEERIEIAKRKYYNYEKGNPVLIGKGDLPIGYVRRIQRQSYRRTNICSNRQTPRRKSKYNGVSKCKKVTLLYRGLNKSSTNIK